MSIGTSLSRSKPCSRFAGMLAIVASLAVVNAGAVLIDCDSNATKVVTPTNTTITVTNSTATLTVMVPGEIEILLVGGGGGAGGATTGSNGQSTNDSRGGGGGGGGVIHKTRFYVGAGTYPITVGAGGAIHRYDSSKGDSVGRSTSGFGLTALGGGPGGLVDPAYNYSIGGLGASGGGGSKHNSNGKASAGGTALASAENENMGHAGANASDYKNAGGGGGAGAAGNGGKGGDGYACDISGETVYYGGGGGGGSRYNAINPGKGGGKANYGGGGSGQGGSSSYPESGGPGIVIIRYTHTEQGTSDDFSVSGYDAKKSLGGGYAYLVITNNTTLHVTGSTSFEVLLVGGGGGAGSNNSNRPDHRGGGGGGGGVIHLRDFPVANGDYAITVGAGGAVNTGAAATTVNGGNTTAFGFTALGGGPGAPASGYGVAIGNIGASGGGGSTDGTSTEGKGIIYGGTAKASVANYNFGNAGANAYAIDTVGAQYNGGAGGGAGGAAVNGIGGDGYACDITGTMVYYGGGGGGGKRYGGGTAKPGLGGGKTSWGGGGSGQYANNNAADGQNAQPDPGGHGIVIIRYKKPQRGATIFLR